MDKCVELYLFIREINKPVCYFEVKEIEDNDRGAVGQVMYTVLGFKSGYVIKCRESEIKKYKKVLANKYKKELKEKRSIIDREMRLFLKMLNKDNVGVEYP